MDVRVLTTALVDAASPLLAIGVFEDEPHLAPAEAVLDSALSGAVSVLLSDKEIAGKLNETALLHTRLLPARRIVVVGLGKRSELTVDRVRQVAGTMAKKARALKCTEICVARIDTALDAQLVAQATIEGLVLGSYQYTQFKSQREDLAPDLGTVSLLVREGEVPAFERGATRGLILAEATVVARNLANGPSNLVTPAYLVDQAREIARRRGLEIDVLDVERMRELAMGAILGVNQGSAQPPYLIVLRYEGAGEGKPFLALVGKAITFDSGGISIKPSEGMQNMKYDMSGGAAVLGAIEALAALKAPVNVLAIVPATENLPGGTAYKPGDIVKAANGKTIEVITTDAEGRLILADALCHAVNLGAAAIVDIATLTGACVVALGSAAAGFMTGRDDLSQTMSEAGEITGDKVWRLPLWPHYGDLMKSDIADMKNSGGRTGGASVGASFLSNFVGDTPWVHVDMAGMSDTDKDLPYTPKGATGFGARLLAEFALRWAEAQW